ncbi:AAA family ATPase [Fulvivirga sp. RKSG066]|uniref:DNA repair ATPase n=1 Tax=Fulvivirga aurantia TaxID=2529383 RepID=UPI0012BD20CA|nr:DNA repair ATPase [Fulvivirga aurantia]MTI21640.1 AAA family ATPase [Fulvivirga aurantia]
MSKQHEEDTKQDISLEGGTYEVLKNRLKNYADELSAALKSLNQSRKDVFGAIETTLIATERINTENNCIPWDMVPIGNQFIFGFNVHLGLKSKVELSDVFSIHAYKDHTFPALDYSLIEDEQFVTDFQKLYKYYKDTQFVKFAKIGPHLYMIFRIGKDISDIKAFKWLIDGDKLTYLDNRSEHEFSFPDQHAFKWKRTTRDYHREGEYPHISIEDKVFVETVGGDLTIKVEDNTDSGHGIYHEEVDNPDQTLDDAEVLYAILGNLILLKIRPYQEKEYRHIVYNSKLQEARSINAIKDACVLLPDGQGVIFSNGYYLQSGDYKLFQSGLENMVYEKTIASPNGEDYLYVFYNRRKGIYLLLPYNIIEQKVENPITCHGYAIFDNGELCFFNADDEPKKHHAAKIWQTPFTGPDFQPTSQNNSYLYKIGNKEVVKAMAECNEVISLVEKGENYDDLYVDLQRGATDIIDSYHWLGHKEAYNALDPLKGIRSTASSAIDEYDKVVRIRKSTREQVNEVLGQVDELVKKISRESSHTLETFVKNLTALRERRGETESLKSLRYVDEQEIDKYEKLLKEENQRYADSCVRFLLRNDALKEYEQKVSALEEAIGEVSKVVEIEELNSKIEQVSKDLEMLIDIVSNLKISDPTQTTQIIDNISALFSVLNKNRATLRKKKREMLLVEGKAEFNAQIKLIEQSVTNYIDLAETPTKCDEYLAKLMVQLEELEGKFSEFDDFVEKISEKREEIYNAFEARKVALVEAKNKRANNLMQSATRILGAAQSRTQRMTTIGEINGYFSSDLMMEKLRNIVAELKEIGDSVKADDIQSRMKSLKEDAIRQLRDKTDLFESGEDIIKFGKYKFTVNTQSLEVTIVPREDNLFYHLTGTNLYEEIKDERLNSTRSVWGQSIVSENSEVYRAEYLAFKILQDADKPKQNGQTILSLDELYRLTKDELTTYVQKYMALRYNEGYMKGVHDHDATLILESLLKFHQNGGLLRFSSESRALARLYWQHLIDDEYKSLLEKRIKGLGIIIDVFPNLNEYSQIIEEIQLDMETKPIAIFPEGLVEGAAVYLFHEIKDHEDFVKSANASSLANAFQEYLKDKKIKKRFSDSINQLKNPVDQFVLINKWLDAYVGHSQQQDDEEFVKEAALILLDPTTQPRVVSIPLVEDIDGFQGSHDVLIDGNYHMNFNRFLLKMQQFEALTVPAFKQFNQVKKELVTEFTEELRFEEFKPRVMASFVRNKLINEVYLPLVGANLAKQIGEAGENKRTDLMGMLLLVSPPGYGKTTLMEYIANRLGIIFMKINGPAIGHNVTSVDPAEAPNAAAREELNKLNLAFEMGDNVMIYLDDIQHCNPELLQKFISLCDAQRKIEGVYKGKSKTYDFRGKKVCVVMAGNPYTESGDKFQIPDMLANRADVYNLGDIIGDAESAFKLSYLENCITSNPVLNKLAGKSQEDVYTLVSSAEKGSMEGAEFEANHSPEEIKEYVDVFNKLFKVRDVILRVNMEYIRSAAQSDEYRTEPSFKLQGSYRDMNKIAEKVFSVMNEEELQTLIKSHYDNEAQTLTSGAEANLLKLKELNAKLTDKDMARWEEIKEIFMKKQRLRGFGMGNQMGQMLSQIEEVTKGLEGIKDALMKRK